MKAFQATLASNGDVLGLNDDFYHQLNEYWEDLGRCRQEQRWRLGRLAELIKKRIIGVKMLGQGNGLEIALDQETVIRFRLGQDSRLYYSFSQFDNESLAFDNIIENENRKTVDKIIGIAVLGQKIPARPAD